MVAADITVGLTGVAVGGIDLIGVGVAVATGEAVGAIIGVRTAEDGRQGESFMPTPLERLNSKIVPEPNTGCWLWLGCLCHDGYPQTRWPETQRKGYAHRLVYELMVGPIPDGHELDHTCFVRDCVNPDHLRPLTPAENKKYRKVPRLSKDEIRRRGMERARKWQADPVRRQYINSQRRMRYAMAKA